MQIPGFSVLNHVGRASEIVRILAKWGFTEVLDTLDVPRVLRPGRKAPEKEEDGYSQWERLRKVCEELGPIFVKLGQILSTLPGRLPRSLTDELKKLRDEVESVPFETMRPVLEEELGQSLEETFAEFQEEPLAAGSLGQIYKARLRSTGEWTAVKVQRPGLSKRLNEDLGILGWIVRQAHENIEAIRQYNLPSVFQEARRALLGELDFNTEAHNSEIFTRQNADPEHIFAPRVYSAYTTRRLVVAEFVAGASPARAPITREQGQELAKIGGKSVFHQVIVCGFFHSDPHSGNVLVTEDGRLCLVDWGQVGIITPQMRYHLADLFTALMRNDSDKVVEIGHKMAAGGRRVDRISLGKEVSFLLTRAHASKRVKQEIGVVGMELIYLFGRFGLQLPADYAMMAKAIVCVEETGLSLDPEFEIDAVSKPFINELLWERWNPLSLFKRGVWNAGDLAGYCKEIPMSLARILKRFEDNDIPVRLDFDALEDFEETISLVFNRLSIAIVVAGVVIGSSLIITTDIEPKLFGYPMIGIIGYFISVVLGLWLVYDILTKRFKGK